jgi:hypothetical protein
MPRPCKCNWRLDQGKGDISGANPLLSAHPHDHPGNQPGAGLVAGRRKRRVENVGSSAERRTAMGLMDRVKEQASMAAQRATQLTQEAAQQGKAKMDQAQAKRRADAMFRDLGAAVYAERTGRGGTDTADKIDRLVSALQQQEAEQGLGDTNGPAPA